MTNKIESILDSQFTLINGLFIQNNSREIGNQKQTNQAFTNKWTEYSQEEIKEKEKLFEFQKNWYLELYGFENESALANFLKEKSVILDAGCGLGYKAKWFADLSPNSLIIGMDFSEAAEIAANTYTDTSNLVFVKGDISNTKLKQNTIDYVSCDQVIHHTSDVSRTYRELVRIMKPGAELAVYVYAKKALPRELLDDYFRDASKNISHEKMKDFSEQLTTLGKRLSELNIDVDIPDLPLLGIKGGKMDIQRFIYWNFLKCFWSSELGWSTSVATNYDWYSPSNAFRYSQEEFLAFAKNNNLDTLFLHTEEACHTGRFRKNI